MNGMKRLRLLFAALLLVLALPAWRTLDLAAIASPLELPVALSSALWFTLFLLLPTKLLVPRLKAPLLAVLAVAYAAGAWYAGPLSKMSSRNPEFGHCGPLTYTGTFYPLRGLLTEAHQDDLDARNQLCWLRKLVARVPERFDGEAEVATYSKIIRDRLLKPTLKYRVGLPLIAILYFRIHAAGGDVSSAKAVYDSLHFWITQYTEEIKGRRYAPWNWPHSSYIQWEYGLVERNWQRLIDGITIPPR
jgi:hypothetical protein